MSGRPPALTVRDGETFGPWTVTEAGLRIWQSPRNPDGHRAARCQCSCGITRLIRVAQLPALDKAGPDCRHGKRGRKPSPAAAARRAAAADAREARIRARLAVPPGWDDTPPGRPRPEPRRREPRRPAAPAVPVSQVRAGATIGAWTVLRDDLTCRGRGAAKVACITCQHTKTVIRMSFAAGRVRACPHKQGRRRPSPARDQALAWITAAAPGQLVTIRQAAGALGISRDAAATRLAALTAEGLLTRHWPGAYSLPGAGPFTQAPPRAGTGDAARDGETRIVRFLAADGGGSFAEIRAATGLDSATLANRLAGLARRGEITRHDDRRGGFWLLPGQEPGQVLDLAETG